MHIQFQYMPFDHTLFSIRREVCHISKGQVGCYQAYPKNNPALFFTIKVYSCPTLIRIAEVQEEIEIEQICFNPHTPRIRGKALVRSQANGIDKKEYFVLQEQLGVSVESAMEEAKQNINSLIWQMLEALAFLESQRVSHGHISKESVFVKEKQFYLTNYSKAKNRLGLNSVMSTLVADIDYQYADSDVLEALIKGNSSFQCDFFKLDVFFLGKLVFQLLALKTIRLSTKYNWTQQLELLDREHRQSLTGRFLQLALSNQQNRPRASKLLQLLKVQISPYSVLSTSSYKDLQQDSLNKRKPQQFGLLDDLQLVTSNSINFSIKSQQQQPEKELVQQIVLSQLYGISVGIVIPVAEIKFRNQMSQRLWFCQLGTDKGNYVAKVHKGLQSDEAISLIKHVEIASSIQDTVPRGYYSTQTKNTKIKLIIHRPFQKCNLHTKLKRIKQYHKIFLCIQLLKIVNKLHRAGILAGNIKPSNILFNDRQQMLLTEIQGNWIRNRVLILSSPEQYHRREVGFPSDVWQVGVTFIIIFNQKGWHGTTSKYYEGEEHDLPIDDIPIQIRETIRRMTSYQADDRMTITQALASFQRFTQLEGRKSAAYKQTYKSKKFHKSAPKQFFIKGKALNK